MEGKHFKEDSYETQRIEHLEAESKRQALEIQALEDKEEKLNGVINELHEAIAELEAENEKLRNEIIRRIVG
jgi:peptidoglycan hydrolase CwlO-like protein